MKTNNWFLDYFILKVFQVIYKSNKDREQQSFRAYLYAGVCMSLGCQAIIVTLGLIAENPLTDLWMDNVGWGTILTYSLSFLLILVRYTQFTNLTEIEAEYSHLPKSQQRWISIVSYFLAIVIVPFFIVVVRLYVVGSFGWDEDWLPK